MYCACGGSALAIALRRGVIALGLCRSSGYGCFLCCFFAFFACLILGEEGTIIYYDSLLVGCLRLSRKEKSSIARDRMAKIALALVAITLATAAFISRAVGIGSSILHSVMALVCPPPLEQTLRRAAVAGSSPVIY